MPFKHYEWGNFAGGGSGSVAPAEADYGNPEQFSGTLVGVTTVNFSSPTKAVTVRNTHATQSLEYSFDNSTWFVLGPYGEASYQVIASNVYLRPVAGNPTYEVLGVLS